jgi:hypothetical protein
VHSDTGNYAHIGTSYAALSATGTNGNAIEAHGDLYVTGAYKGGIGPNGGAPFPRPAYDSGWVNLPNGNQTTLDPSLPVVSYNNSNFFIHVRTRNGGVEFRHYNYPNEGYGYNINSNNTILVYNYSFLIDQVRIQVWYIY